jgi:lysophospholipase
MRRFAALFLAVCLVACSKPNPVLAPFVEPRLPPSIETAFWPPQGWAWGVMQVAGKPAQRYGVSAPPAMPYADVIILAGYGESGEMWFEIARGLNKAGYTVWVLDGVGQGGSGRYTKPRDLGYAPDAQADADNLDLFLQRVVRPPENQRVVVIASGTAWLPALAAFEDHPLASQLILSDPDDPAPPTGSGKDADRGAGQVAWTRPAAALPRRQAAALAWATANPDLRMGGKAWGWFTARAKLRAKVLEPTRLAAVQTPVLILARRANLTPCLKMPHCVEQSIATSVPYQQAEDADRGPWLAALMTALTADHAP